MDRYPIETLPFPVRPRDNVYCVFYLYDGEPCIVDIPVDVVEVNAKNKLSISCYEGTFEVGPKDRCFLTHKDAVVYLKKNSPAFTDAYGTTDFWPHDVPFRPGKAVYICDDDPPEVFETTCRTVLFTNEGEVIIIDTLGLEICVVGANPYTCFPTRQEAYDYLNEQGHSSIGS